MALSPMTLHRLSAAARCRGLPIVPKALQALTFVLFKAVVPVEAEIGAGTVLAHGGVGVVIHPDAIIGSNVLINSGVVIGGRSRKGVPTIGDNVYLGAGCKVLGDVRVGAGAIVGANAVVTHDIPERSIAVGVPARVTKRDIAVDDYEVLPHRARRNMPQGRG